VINLEKTQEKQAEQMEFNSRSEELLHKFYTGQTTHEEANELSQKSLAVALETVDVVKELEDKLAACDDAISLRDTVITIYQEFINAKELQEEFSGFYEGIFEDELREEESDLEESDAVGNDVH
jgi:hypothetical protein